METQQLSSSQPNKKAKIDVAGLGPTSCPHLGSKYDRATPFAYPNRNNLCYRHQDALSRQLQFQRTFCISENYRSCSIFLDNDRDPDNEISSGSQPQKGSSSKKSLAVVLILIAFFTLVSFSILALGAQEFGAISLPF